jgi:hypothetical protein
MERHVARQDDAPERMHACKTTESRPRNDGNMRIDNGLRLWVSRAGYVGDKSSRNSLVTN